MVRSAVKYRFSIDMASLKAAGHHEGGNLNHEGGGVVLANGLNPPFPFVDLRGGPQEKAFLAGWLCDTVLYHPHENLYCPATAQ